MRGCLFVVIIAIMFLTGAIWFGGPPLASAVVTSSLASSGFSSQTLDVEVTAEPPLTLAIGRANTIAIDATGVTWNKLKLASLSLNLRSVDLIARTAKSADGQLGGVRFTGTGGQPVVADVDLSGPADAARATITVDAVTVSAMALAAFDADFGVRPSSATLVAPDIIQVKVGGLTLTGHLSIAKDGSIVATANGSTTRILAPDPSLPVLLTGLAVTPTELELRGTVDVSSLLR
jgi:hypothetical protein